MTTPAQPPIATTPTFVIPGSEDPSLSDPVTIFTVPLNVPARVDAIYMRMDYLDVAHINGEQFVIQYIAPGGYVQAQVWTPTYDQGEVSSDASYLTLTWARFGNGTDQLVSPEPTVLTASGVTTVFFTGTFTLPDVVLTPSTLVQVARVNIASGATITVSDAAVTYTPNGTGTAETSLTPLTPFLLPASNS